MLKWQLQTYQALRAAYFEMLRAHEAERDARETSEGGPLGNTSPAELSRIVREEMKREVVTMLLAEQSFAGFDAIQTFPDGRRPVTNIARAVGSAPLIQFIEQAFEWENMTYICYPYFWGAGERWDDLLDARSSDSDYARFLRAGSARVVLPARPAAQWAALYFVATGVPWGGGPAPIPDDPDYVSIADEIEAETGNNDPGTPVRSSWEVRLPTTLVVLDDDSALPLLNSDARIAPPQT